MECSQTKMQRIQPGQRVIGGAMGVLAPVIENPAPEVVEEDIIARIQKRIPQRRTEAEAQGLDYGPLVEGTAMGFSPGLYYDLYLARKRADTISDQPLVSQHHPVPLFPGDQHLPREATRRRTARSAFLERSIACHCWFGR